MKLAEEPSSTFEKSHHILVNTVADCFKYRNKIGLDVAQEALIDCRRHKLCSKDELWKYAQICRVTKIMKPYLEVIDGVLEGLGC